MIHVSGCEVLLHDAQLAAQRLAAAGVAVELQVWPGQIHVFQLAAPMIPEATRSLRKSAATSAKRPNNQGAPRSSKMDFGDGHQKSTPAAELDPMASTPVNADPPSTAFVLTRVNWFTG